MSGKSRPTAGGAPSVSEGNVPAVHIHSLIDGTDQTLALPAGWAWAGYPAISGDFIALDAYDGSQSHILVYDVVDGTFRQITNTAGSEILADISASTTGGTTTVHVVWQVNEGDDNVYASQFTVTSAPPFTGQFLQPVNQTSDPANPVINTGKNGRVIPVKVQISQGGTAITDQNAPGPVTIGVAHMSSCASGAATDSIEAYADAGQSSAGTNQFSYNPVSQAWIYNLDTKALGLVTGNCYRIGVTVDGTPIASPYAIFQPTK